MCGFLSLIWAGLSSSLLLLLSSCWSIYPQAKTPAVGSTCLLPQTQVCDQERPGPWGRSWGREPRGPPWYLADLRHQDSLVLKVML